MIFFRVTKFWFGQQKFYWTTESSFVNSTKLVLFAPKYDGELKKIKKNSNKWILVKINWEEIIHVNLPKWRKKSRNSVAHFSVEFPHCFWRQKSEKCVKMLRKLCRKMDSRISALFFLLGWSNSSSEFDKIKVNCTEFKCIWHKSKEFSNIQVN